MAELLTAAYPLRTPIVTKRRVLLAAAIFVIALVVAGLLPAPAHAGIKDEVVKAVQNVFGFKPNGITATFLTWLIKIPTFVDADRGPGALQQVTAAIAFGGLGAIVTLSVFHYWASGLSMFGGNGVAPLEGVTRTAGAGLFILAWPWIFDSGVTLTNITTHALAPGKELDGAVGALFSAGQLKILGLGAIVGLMVSILLALLLIIIAIIKIGMSAALLVIFVAMPILVALWPLPGTSWVAQYALRACTALVLIPILWALIIKTFFSLGRNAFAIGTTKDPAVLDALILPLVGAAMLYLMLVAPGMLLRAGGVSTGGRSFITSFMSFTASHFAFNALASKLPVEWGGRRADLQVTRDASGAVTEVGFQQKIGRATSAKGVQALREGNVALSDKLAREAAQAGGNPARFQQEARNREAAMGRTPNWATQSRREITATRGATNVQRQTDLAGQAQDRRNRWTPHEVISHDHHGGPRRMQFESREAAEFETQNRLAKPSAEQLAGGYGQLSPEWQARIDEVSTDPSHYRSFDTAVPDFGVREHLAGWTAQDGVDPLTRDTLRMFGAAEPDARFEGIRLAQERLTATQESSETT